jgi:polyhydroxyalkanoate synthesis regulator phasin
MQNGQKVRDNMDWVYERLDKLVESGEMTEEEARREYIEYKEAQAEEYMNECVYREQF